MAERVSLARGTAEVGSKVEWLNPSLCKSGDTERAQRGHIEIHGEGPFTVIELEPFQTGDTTLVCFRDKNGKIVKFHPIWLHQAAGPEKKTRKRRGRYE